MFTVYTYEYEFQFLKDHVIQRDKIETGGDLFGLWIDDRSLVVQVITGPGEGCRRTTTSFFQDVNYLKRVGEHLTQHQGLCNVGEWHSHHRLGLASPSYGDQKTVWQSMPEGLTRFVVFIANISGESNVNVGCFLFDKISNEMITGDFMFLDECSPMSRNLRVRNILKEGAEKLPTGIKRKDSQNKNEAPENKKRRRDKEGQQEKEAKNYINEERRAEETGVESQENMNEKIGERSNENENMKRKQQEKQVEVKGKLGKDYDIKENKKTENKQLKHNSQVDREEAREVGNNDKNESFGGSYNVKQLEQVELKRNGKQGNGKKSKGVGHDMKQHKEINLISKLPKENSQQETKKFGNNQHEIISGKESGLKCEETLGLQEKKEKNDKIKKRRADIDENKTEYGCLMKLYFFILWILRGICVLFKPFYLVIRMLLGRNTELNERETFRKDGGRGNKQNRKNKRKPTKKNKNKGKTGKKKK